VPAAPTDQSAAATPPVLLVLGLRPERLLDAEGRIDAFVDPPGPEQVGILVEAVSSGLQAAGSVVAIVPEWVGRLCSPTKSGKCDAAGRLAMVRSMLDTHRLAIHVTTLPPLAATALASLASAAAPHVPSTGVLASLLPELEARVHAFTWLGSVTGLSTPAPSFAQHIGSLAPGSAFGVSSFPEPSVTRLHRDGPTVPLPELAGLHRLVVAPRGGDPDWVLNAVNPALGRLDVRRVEPTPGGERWWGTAKLVESVAIPLEVERLAAELVAGLDPWTCRWCGELVARSPCPLCGHRGRPARRRAAAPAA
jgi:hypothetical protein